MTIRGFSAMMRGFTLVELAIVVAIIGLLIAGITVGASLIKQAEIRAVISELQTYQTAYNNFRGTYGNKIPGDMSTASAFWTIEACADTAALCDGDGNRIINEAADSSNSLSDDETRPAWKHLALAGMVNAGITNVPATFVPLKPGNNAPASRLSGAGYELTSVPLPPSGSNANVLILGKPSNDLTISNGGLLYSALTPQDAFTIDQKLDDGVVVSTMLSPIDRLINSAFACDICTDTTCGCDPADPAYNNCVSQNQLMAATMCNIIPTGPAGGTGGTGTGGTGTGGTGNGGIGTGGTGTGGTGGNLGGSTSGGTFTGATTGNILVSTGANSRAQCTNGNMYDLTITDVACVIAMRLQ